MPLSRRQRSAFSSVADDHRSTFDVESPVGDLGDVNIIPTPPQPFLSTLPTPPRSTRGSSPYLRYAWQQQHQQQQRENQAPSRPDGELAVSLPGPPPASPKPLFGPDYNRHAPMYAFNDGHLEQQRQELRREKREQHRKPHYSQCGDSCSGGKGTCRDRKYRRRLKVIGCIIVGALTLDFYLVWCGRPAETASMRLGKLSSSKNHDRWSWHGGRMGYRRRSAADRYVEMGGRGRFGQDGAREANAEQTLSPHMKFIREAITPQRGQSSTRPHEHPPAAPVRGVTAADRPSIPGESTPGQQAQRSLMQPDRFDGQRVAVVVPYVGGDLPVWWDAFAEQAKLNDGLVDWIIFCDQASRIHTDRDQFCLPKGAGG